MPIIDTRTLSSREPKPGWHGRFFESAEMTFAYYAIDAGASLHEHSHPNEEVWNVLSGELEITIGADEHRLGPGAAAIVPPNTAHSVRSLTASIVIVVDQGVRTGVGGGERAALSIELRAPADRTRRPSRTRSAPTAAARASCARSRSKAAAPSRFRRRAARGFRWEISPAASSWRAARRCAGATPMPR
jgi:quercetin dioxygenase-like cupin family protein